MYLVYSTYKAASLFYCICLFMSALLLQTHFSRQNCIIPNCCSFSQLYIQPTASQWAPRVPTRRLGNVFAVISCVGLSRV